MRKSGGRNSRTWGPAAESTAVNSEMMKIGMGQSQGHGEILNRAGQEPSFLLEVGVAGEIKMFVWRK